MHINLDSNEKIKGYYDSPWPAECGGPRRQKIPRSPGLNISNGEYLSQKTRANGEWNVMMVLRDPGEVFLMGNCLLYTSPSPRDMRRSRMPSSA